MESVEKMVAVVTMKDGATQVINLPGAPSLFDAMHNGATTLLTRLQIVMDDVESVTVTMS